MAHDSLFDSAWLKWAWAVSHTVALENEIALLYPDGQPPLTTKTEYHPKRHAFAVVVETIPLLPPDWGLRLGDIAFNYRSALDHLAWAVVSQGKKPPAILGEKKSRGIVFPVSDDNRAFNARVPDCLPGVKRTDIAVVRRFQPYSRGQRRVPLHPLSILARLNNHDKHRQIQPVLALPMVGDFKLAQSRDCDFGKARRSRREALDVGAEVGIIPVRKTGAQPELEVEVRLTAQICLDNRVPITQWLTKTKELVGRLLLAFANPPGEVLALDITIP